MEHPGKDSAAASAQLRDQETRPDFSGARALFVATVYRHIAAFHLPYIRLLQSWGVRVDVAAAPDAARDVVSPVADRCIDVPMVRSPFRLRNLWAVVQLWRIMRQERYDLVHVHTPVGSVVGRVAAHFAGIPSVLYTAHGFHFYRGAPFYYWLLYYPVEGFLARWTDVLITINEEDFQRAQRFRMRRGDPPVLVAGVGVELERFDPDQLPTREVIRDRLGLPQDAPVLLAVGEINANKNYGSLVDMVRRLLEQYPTLYVLIAGDGPLRDRVQKLIQRLGVADHVRLLGFRSDIAELFKAADLVVSLSKREGLPVNLIEAAAAGKPIMATDVRGNSDVVAVVGGRLVPPRNSEEAARVAANLLENPAQRRRLGDDAKRRAIRFAASRVLSAVAIIYYRALSGQRRRRLAK